MAIHSIGKLNVELRVHGQLEGFQLQQLLQQLIYEELLPALERQLDQMAPDDAVLSIDRLDLPLDGLDAVQWTQQLVPRMLQQLRTEVERRLQSTLPEERLVIRPLRDSLFDAWLYFLENGALPPTRSSAHTEAALQEAVLSAIAGQEPALRRFLTLLQQKPHTLQRLVWQHPPVFLLQLGEACTGAGGSALFRLFDDVDFWLQHSPDTAPAFFLQEKTRGDAAVWPVVADNARTLRDTWPERFWTAVWQHLAQHRQWPAPATVLRPALLTVFAIPTLKTWTYWLKTEAKKLGKAGAPASTRAIVSLLTTTEKTTGTATPADDVPLKVSRAGMPGEDSASDAPAPKPIEAPASDAPLFSAAEKAGGQLPPGISPGKPALGAMVKTTDEEAAEGNTPKPPEGDFWYVPNAGLIVLHPFIAPYFEHLKILKDQSFIHKKAQAHAVYLLHWLATGEEQAPEYDLMLPKLLAGWPLDAPLPRAARLSEAEKTEGLEMLQTVVRYWGRLGSTSPDGLREGFLRRPGKLTYPGPWRLQMEQSTLDILLQGLPWGIGIVKLPWMSEMLYVEWNY